MKTCYMVAVIGQTKGALASCFANTRERAESACAALFVDTFGEAGEATAFDEGAKPGIWIEGSPEYIRSIVG
ncbi:hypothetical protein KTE29_03785 [Burkholderia multivorans]|uniref:hypothetical protein n=1 Tax=Burkholderia multivorans TaxID=87883 RepID=UPI001C220A2A|nr:hypothetical protein [Burkholderia multivorans]MBU9446902.1 hypothetical protein [Burkholderia multivorans]UQN68041.1 hypothetical protein L0Z45_10040 [Burkholderia multivorans]UQN73770.1 hypothetical protein L0Z11_10020 [Burkholderia multivorans]HEF4739573.1 hypothetical protein [Burkholderia multivorans]